MGERVFAAKSSDFAEPLEVFLGPFGPGVH